MLDKMDSKNILLVATTSSMIELFNSRNIKILQKLGFNVFVAANFKKPGSISVDDSEKFIHKLENIGVKWYQVDFKRGIGNPFSNHRAYLKLLEIVKNNNISLIHTQAPLNSIIARRVAKKLHIQCIYTAHGFQFFPFKQVWIGKHDQPFTILKFRTMSQNAPHQMATEKFENPEAFITPIGSKLRKMSLDELPQLFNVLKGDMSLIGPRPLIPKEKQVLQWRDKCGAENVLPGITGLAQVHGRDELTGKKKAMFDGKYANNVSAWLDLKTFFKTIVDVICGRGIHEGKNEKIRMWF